jgi:hypothetical protein
MVEIVISTVSTGRVRRLTFPNRDEAATYLDRWENAKPPKGRRYRVEWHYWPDPDGQATLPLTTTASAGDGAADPTLTPAA